MRNSNPLQVVGELMTEDGLIRLTFATGDVSDVIEKTVRKQVQYVAKDKLTNEKLSAMSKYFQKEVKNK